jgi:hypothetical protein
MFPLLHSSDWLQPVRTDFSSRQELRPPFSHIFQTNFDSHFQNSDQYAPGYFFGVKRLESEDDKWLPSIAKLKNVKSALSPSRTYPFRSDFGKEYGYTIILLSFSISLKMTSSAQMF